MNAWLSITRLAEVVHVSIQGRNGNRAAMEIRLTPDEAERAALTLRKCAARARIKP